MKHRALPDLQRSQHASQHVWPQFIKTCVTGRVKQIAHFFTSLLTFFSNPPSSFSNFSDRLTNWLLSVWILARCCSKSLAWVWTVVSSSWNMFNLMGKVLGTLETLRTNSAGDTRETCCQKAHFLQSPPGIGRMCGNPCQARIQTTRLVEWTGHPLR